MSLYGYNVGKIEWWLEQFDLHSSAEFLESAIC